MSVSLTELGVPTLHVRKAGAISAEKISGGGGIALPTTAHGHIATAPQLRLFTQSVKELSGKEVANGGTLTTWFKIMPDVSTIKIWFSSADAAPELSFGLSDLNSGSIYSNTALADQTGTATSYFMISDLSGVPWIRVVYSNNSGGAITPTDFFCTQVTGMSGAVSEVVTGVVA